MSLNDIHSHVLFGIDDGAMDVEESIAMLNKMITAGVSHVVATPHLNLEKKRIEDFIKERNSSYEILRAQLLKNEMNIDVLLGCELMYTSTLGHVDLSQLTINDTDYILIELSTRYDDPSLENTMYQILANGYIPVLAHVERYSYLINDSERLVNLIHKGVLMQVNVSSLSNTKNYPFVETMLRKNLIHFIGSDMHNMRRRSITLSKEQSIVKLNENAKDLLANKLINIEAPKKMIKVFKKYL